MRWIATPAKNADVVTLQKRLWDVADERRTNSGLSSAQTAQSRARIRDAIEEALDGGLPRAYTPDVFKTKAGVVFQHVYERYGRAA